MQDARASTATGVSAVEHLPPLPAAAFAQPLLQQHDASSVAQVAVMGFSAARANLTCRALRPLRCAQWPGVRVSSWTDERIDGYVRAGYILPPDRYRGGLGNVGLAMAHVSAWQLAASAPTGHRTLIMEEDETVLQPALVVSLLQNTSFDFDLCPSAH